MDFTTEADRCKLKLFRNEVCHLKQVGYTHQDFQQKWSEYEPVLLRLGKGNVQLTYDLQTLKYGNIDPAKAMAYEKQVEEWEKRDDAIQQDLLKLRTKVAEVDERVSQIDKQVKNLSTTYVEHADRISNVESHNEQVVRNLSDYECAQLTMHSRLETTESLFKQLRYGVVQEIAERDRMKYHFYPELRNLNERATLCIEECDTEQEFVFTTAYYEAKKKLEINGCVILTGLPGEGKTTMAVQLMSAIAGSEKSFKLQEPAEWVHINLNDRPFIFIDDIFGAGVLDDSLLRGWSKILSNVEKAVRLKKIQVIITTRHYILKEAKEKMEHLNLFQNENIQLLQSSELTQIERKSILEAHLRYRGRNFSHSLADNCNAVSSFHFGDYSKNQKPIREEQLHLNENEEDRINHCFIGFPEIAMLFASNDELYRKGVVFFESPLDYFKSCMKDLFRVRENFFPLLLIWFQPEEELKLTELESHFMSHIIDEIIKLLEIDTDTQFQSKLKHTLENHRSGYLSFNEKTGTYRFCHKVISDMVGVVAGQEYPEHILRKAREDFILQYFTTDISKKDPYHIFLEEFRFESLNDVICKHLLNVDSPLIRVEDRKPYIFRGFYNETIVVRQMKYRDLPITLGAARVNESILKHDCFDNQNFVRLFLDSPKAQDLLLKPVLCISGQFGYYGIDFKRRTFSVYLPSLSLLSGQQTLYKEFINHFSYGRLKHFHDFNYITLLIASHMGMKNICDIALESNTLPLEDAIFIAAESQHLEVLEYLLNHNSRQNQFTNLFYVCNPTYCPNFMPLLQQNVIKSTESSFIISGNSPLINASRKGLTSSVKCLLENGVDLNYRNKNDMSALDKAILYIQPEVCLLLLQHGASVNHRRTRFNRTPLLTNADVGGLNGELITQYLLHFGASVWDKDYRGHLPIHCAAIRGNTKIVDVLLRSDVSQSLKILKSYGKLSKLKGMDLVHIAVWKQNIELLDVLLSHGCNPNHLDSDGRTPFYCAVIGSDDNEFQLIEKLIPISNVKQADKNGCTPLHAAIHKGKTMTAKLICPISDVNAQDKYGKTPLHTACEQQNSEIIRTLIEEYDADFRILTNQGKSILNILQTTLVRPTLEHFLWPKTIKQMKPEGIQAGVVYVEKIPVWVDIFDIIRNKDPEFVKLWVEIYRRVLSSKKKKFDIV